MNAQSIPEWQGKISSPAQLGGIELMVLENGPARGTRIAWINTGSGLRFKVVIDRGMDIADAFFNQFGLAWLSHAGITSPQPSYNKGVDWLQGFGGGLLTTCGLTHVGGPEQDEFGQRGLHGEYSNQPAELQSIIQPDPAKGRMDMGITGITRIAPLFGPALELKRTITCTIGRPVIRIHDEVVNIGNTSAPHMLLYHCNFGWPLVDEGTDLLWNGDCKPRFESADNLIFRDGHNFRKCPAPMKEHSASGEEVGIIDPIPDVSGTCSCGLYNSKIGLGLALRFRKEELPWLTNWQHWGRGEYVTALEPGTHPPIGQAQARKDKTLVFLAPGERRDYHLEVELYHDKKSVAGFLATYDQTSGTGWEIPSVQP